MCVDLSRRDVRVAEHHLDRAEIGAALEEMARERMAEHVWRDAAPKPGLCRRLAHDRPERLPRERSPAWVHEQPAAVALPRVERPRFMKIARDPLRRLGAERHHALLAGLPGAHVLA